MKPKRGRPPKPAAEVRATPMTIRVTEAEKLAIESAAKRAKTSVSEWSRSVLLKASK